MDELKPCPSCGATRGLYVLEDLENFEHYVFCDNCKTSIHNEHAETKDDAIESWNLRANECDRDELIKVADEINADAENIAGYLDSCKGKFSKSDADEYYKLAGWNDRIRKALGCGVMEELKPCPFCCGYAFKSIDSVEPIIRIRHNRGCFIEEQESMLYCKENIDVWNRRANDCDRKDLLALADELDGVILKDDCDECEVTTVSAYDLLSDDDREALAWVREMGGVEAVEKRLMPEGMEWLLEVWPKWSNGDYCKFGDWWTAGKYGDYEPKQLIRLGFYTPEQLKEWEQDEGDNYGYEWNFMRPSDTNYRPDKAETPASMVEEIRRQYEEIEKLDETMA